MRHDQMTSTARARTVSVASGRSLVKILNMGHGELAAAL